MKKNLVKKMLKYFSTKIFFLVTFILIFLESSKTHFDLLVASKIEAKGNKILSKERVRIIIVKITGISHFLTGIFFFHEL